MTIFHSHFMQTCVLTALLFTMAFFAIPAVAQTSTATTGPETVDLVMNKQISGETRGFLLSDFSYLITGTGVSETVPHGGSVALEIGTYSIEELVPAGFFKSDWRIGWYGECDAGSAYSTTVTIDDGNVDHGTLDCQADNQYRPDNGDNPEYGCTDSSASKYDAVATIDDGSCEYIVLGCTDTAANNYNSLATDDDGSCTYDPDPIPGCTDTSANNYDAAATIDDGSCTYDETFVIEGYVWHDANENGVIDSGEEYLQNWGLQIVNGSTTLTTTSGAGGYYSFSVPAGTWVLSETVESGWEQVFPTPTTYAIVVPDDLTGCNTITSIGFPFNLFTQVAHAASCMQYNFGNLFTDDGGGNGGSDDLACSLSASDTTVQKDSTVTLTWGTTGATAAEIDNGIGTTTLNGSTDVTVSGDTTYTLSASTGSSTVTCTVSVTTNTTTTGGGNGKKIQLSSGSGGSASNDDEPLETPEPTPVVLGEQVEFVPFGAPNAGAGGAAPSHTPALLAALVLAVATVRRVVAQ